MSEPEKERKQKILKICMICVDEFIVLSIHFHMKLKYSMVWTMLNVSFFITSSKSCTLCGQVIVDEENDF